MLHWIYRYELEEFRGSDFVEDEWLVVHQVFVLGTEQESWALEAGPSCLQ